jgi:hypothetical protein
MLKIVELRYGRKLELKNPSPLRAELHGSDRASIFGITVRSPTPILRLSRWLLERGIDPDTPLEAWRGETLVLRVRGISEAARLRVSGDGLRFERLPLTPETPPAASPMRSDASEGRQS